MNKKRILVLNICLLLFIVSIPAYATNEATLPEMIGALSLWFVLPGLIMEYVLIKLLTKSSITRTIIIDIVMKLGSLLLGTGLIIIILRFLYLVFKFFKIDNSYIWRQIGPWFLLLLLLSTIFLYVVIEKLIIETIFKNKIGKKGFWGLVLTNCLSIGVFFFFSFYLWRFFM